MGFDLKRQLTTVPNELNPIYWIRLGRFIPGLQANLKTGAKKMLPEPGRYPAKTTETTVYENQNGTLCFSARFSLDDGKSITGYFSLSRKDGSLNEFMINNLKEVYGWDGVDPFWLVDNDLSSCPVEITVENQTRPDNSVFTTVKYLDKPGGGGGGMPQQGDRNAILSKFGSRLRAMAGGTPAAKPTPAPAPPQPPPPSQPPTTPPPSNVKPMEMSEAWSVFCEKAGPAVDQNDLQKCWFKAIQEVTGKTAEACSPDDWGRVAAAASDYVDEIPF
jgi:hypothetical protein